MKTPHQPPCAGFTLIELLVVISIIGILAGMLLPALAKAKERAQVAKAKSEINNIVMAISQYEGDYHRYPVGRNARKAGSMDTSPGPDFTFGTTHSWWRTRAPTEEPEGYTRFLRGKRQLRDDYLPDIFGPSQYKASNAEVMSILRDETGFPDGTVSCNVDHSLNPKRRGYISAKVANAVNQPGIGPDGVYRDPWSNPYIISLDLNGDDRCRDAFYRLDTVNGGTGLNGLTKPGTGANNFELNSGIMVWSLGPDMNAAVGVKATDKPNRDNVLSWQ